MRHYAPSGRPPAANPIPRRPDRRNPGHRLVRELSGRIAVERVGGGVADERTSPGDCDCRRGSRRQRRAGVRSIGRHAARARLRVRAVSRPDMAQGCGRSRGPQVEDRRRARRGDVLGVRLDGCGCGVRTASPVRPVERQRARARPPSRRLPASDVVRRGRHGLRGCRPVERETAGKGQGRQRQGRQRQGRQGQGRQGQGEG